MISITLLTNEPGRLSMEAGQIYFLNVPLQTERDVKIYPPGVVSFADARDISTALLQGPHVIKGKVGRYLWRRSE
jgi:hypothetical protein